MCKSGPVQMQVFCVCVCFGTGPVFDIGLFPKRVHLFLILPLISLSCYSLMVFCEVYLSELSLRLLFSIFRFPPRFLPVYRFDVVSLCIEPIIFRKALNNDSALMSCLVLHVALRRFNTVRFLVWNTPG